MDKHQITWGPVLAGGGFDLRLPHTLGWAPALAGGSWETTKESEYLDALARGFSTIHDSEVAKYLVTSPEKQHPTKRKLTSS